MATNHPILIPMSQKISPGDLLRAPIQERASSTTRADLALLPESWRTVLDETSEWPFVDPDVMLDSKDPSFADFPADEVPEEIVPFSEFEPWGKMDTETPRDYELFSEYRASGLSRTFSKTARHFSISQPRVSKVANKHDWVERVHSWDKYREQIYTTTVIEGVKKMALEHAGIANKGIKAYAMVFDELIERIENDPLHKEEMNTMSLRALFALVDKAARGLPNLMNAERLSRGLPTELSAQVVVTENRIIVQTTEELGEIIHGLGGVLEAVGEETEIADAEYEDIDESA